MNLLDLLPHRPPALHLDEILEHDPGRRAVAARTYPAGHAVFDGHLPGDPIVPGVILIEAMAQLSGLVFARPEGPAVQGRLAAVDAARFRRPVRPGERIVLVSTLDRVFGSAARFEATASVEGEEAARATITVGGVAIRSE